MGIVAIQFGEDIDFSEETDDTPHISTVSGLRFVLAVETTKQLIA
jgi:hypothetical protein